MSNVSLTQSVVDRARHNPSSRGDRTIFWDRSIKGFGLQVTEQGAKSFVFQYRVDGKSRRMRLDGKFLRLEAERERRNGGKPRVLPNVTSPLAAARIEAEVVRAAIAQGRDPLAELQSAAAETTNTLKAIATEYMRREGRKLRSGKERERILAKHVYPYLGSRQIGEIKRSDIIKRLDAIEDQAGPASADQVLAILRRIFNWHAARSDDFRSPITRSMARTKPKERARERVLSDAELRAIWTAAGYFPDPEARKNAAHPYGLFIRFVLLTATRRNEAARMNRRELDGGTWTIPAKRHKSKRDFVLPLSRAARELLQELPALGSAGWLFTSGGDKPISGFSKWKAEFDKLVLRELRKANPQARLKRWTIHDLRRTARSLMSRAGVDPDHAERAIGHVIPGVRGVYDRHAFLDEKAQAFEALAAEIARIVKTAA